ncbi:hypothetical protein J2TS4_04490 [Paenibacillus sp. J2TS4]|nr:hypothetical protein J2TS4_04490 [Paenibacillus sp. J2TS4]
MTMIWPANDFDINIPRNDRLNAATINGKPLFHSLTKQVDEYKAK